MEASPPTGKSEKNYKNRIQGDRQVSQQREEVGSDLMAVDLFLTFDEEFCRGFHLARAVGGPA